LSASFAGLSADSKRSKPVARRVAAWLGILATPTFAALAVLTYVDKGSAMHTMCGVDAPPMAGMDAMYLLMSVFHSAPWLKLVAKRTNPRNRRSTP